MDAPFALWSYIHSSLLSCTRSFGSVPVSCSYLLGSGACGKSVLTTLVCTPVGGIGLRQARQAEELIEVGDVHFDDPTKFQVPGNNYCYDVPQEPVVNETTGEVVFEALMPGITPVCVVESSTASWFNVMVSSTGADAANEVFFTM